MSSDTNPIGLKKSIIKKSNEFLENFVHAHKNKKFELDYFIFNYRYFYCYGLKEHLGYILDIDGKFGSDAGPVYIGEEWGEDMRYRGEADTSYRGLITREEYKLF